MVSSFGILEPMDEFASLLETDLKPVTYRFFKLGAFAFKRS
jgi:hypothetical protein